MYTHTQTYAFRYYIQSVDLKLVSGLRPEERREVAQDDAREQRRGALPAGVRGNHLSNTCLTHAFFKSGE